MRFIIVAMTLFVASNAWADFSFLQAQIDALSAKKKPAVVRPKPKPKPVAKKKAKRYLNIFWDGPQWSYPGPRTKQNVINHLMQGQHAGLFKRWQLETLKFTQLESLHSNSHEERPFRSTPHRFTKIVSKPVEYVEELCPT